jgi:uncharacterized membrane protein
MTEQQTPEMPASVIIESTYSGAFGHGWDTMKKYFIELLLVIFVLILFSIPMAIMNSFVDRDTFGSSAFTIFIIAYGIIILGPISFGANWIFLKAARHESFKTYDMFMAFQYIWKVVVANILVSIIVSIGFVLLIVPGIIFACRLAFVSYLVMDEKMEAIEAIKKSWEMTRGYSWTIFGMAIMSFFICLAGLICLVVGIFPAIIWIESSFASLYWAVATKNNHVGQIL